MFVLLLTAVAEQGTAQEVVSDPRLRSTGGFAGIELGVMQFGTAHLNGPSATLRLGSTLDRRGLLRGGLLVGGAGSGEIYLTGAGWLELRPLSPRRITPLLGVSAGVLQVIEDAQSRHTHVIVLFSGGVAVRIGQAHTVTLRGQYGDSYKRAGFYSIHVGFEFGI